MTDSEETAVKPFFKTDSGSFGGDLKMPILGSLPGRRPGDFCLDDVIGSVKVRRQDQSILILGGVGGTPSWAQTVNVGSSSGASITVDGNITFPLSSSIITSSGDLTLAAATGTVDVSTGSVLAFSGTGVLRSAGGDLTLSSGSGNVIVIGDTLLFNQSATIGSPGALAVSSTGVLPLIPSNGKINVLSSVLSFNQPATIDVLGTLSFIPQSGIIAFPNDITMLPSPDSNFYVTTSGNNTGVLLQKTDSLGGFFSLINYHLVSSSSGPPTVTKSDPSATYTVSILDGSTDTAGGFTLFGDVAQDFQFIVNFYRPYTEATKVFVVFYPINLSAATSTNFETIYTIDPVVGRQDCFEVFGKFNTSPNTTLIYSYIVVGVL